MSAPVDVTFQPLALVDLGLASDYNGFGYPNVLSGVALNTFGWLWDTEDRWTRDSPAVTSVWTKDSASASTTWTKDAPSVTSVWTTEYLP